MQNNSDQEYRELTYGCVCSLLDDSSLFKDETFFQKLLADPDKKVKIVTAIGAKGHGKSTVLNCILSLIPTVKKTQIFNQSNSFSDGTIGIEYYFIEQKDTSLLILDCQGFDDSDNENNYYSRLRFLVCLICKISTVVIHVSTEIRETNGFLKFLKCIDLDNKKDYNRKNLVCNFVEIVNLRKPKQFKQQKYPNLISQAYYLEFMESEGDEIFEEFSYHNENVFKSILKCIEKASYEPIDEKYYSSFKDENTYQTLHKLFNSSFILLNNIIPPISQQPFMEMVNESIKVDVKCKMVYDQAQDIINIYLHDIYKTLQDKQKKTLISNFFFTQIVIPAVSGKQHLKTMKIIEKIYEEWNNKYNQINNQFEENTKEAILEQFKSWHSSFPKHLRPWDNVDRNSSDSEISKLGILSVRFSIIGCICFLGGIALEISFPRIAIGVALGGTLGVFAGIALGFGFVTSKISGYISQRKADNFQQEVRKFWLNISLPNEIYPNFLQEKDKKLPEIIHEYLSKNIKDFSKEILKIENIDKRKYYTLLTFFNIVLVANQSDDNAIQFLQEYGSIFVEVVKQFKEKQEKQSAVPNELFKKINEFKQTISSKDFKYFDGLVKINNKELLLKVQSYLSLDDEWRNIFSCLVLLNNLHPNFLSLFLIEVSYSHHIYHEACFEIFSQEENINEFLTFQTNILKNIG